MLIASNGVNSFIQLITVLLIFAIVLAITLFVTKWIAGFQKQKMSCNNMQVIEAMRLTPNQFIQIVRIGSKYFAIAVSKEHIALLTEIKESELVIKEGDDTPDFASVLGSIKDRFEKKDDESSEDSGNEKNN